MVAGLGEDGEGQAAGYEGEECLDSMEEGFGLLVVALFDAHGGWKWATARVPSGIREGGCYVQ